MSTTKSLIWLVVALSIASIVFFTRSGFNFSSSTQPPAELLAVLRPHSTQLTDFSLTDHNNRPFTLQQLDNKNTLVFFGYTSCPDICPTTLATLNLVYERLKQNQHSQKYNIVFVSVDPERDSIKKLSVYMHFFNPDFLAVTATKEAIDQFARQFGAGYVIEEKSSDGAYLVSHTSSIFLVNPQLNLIASFSPPHHAEIIESQLQLIEEMSE